MIAPIAGFIILSWYGNRMSREIAGLFGCGTVGISFLVTLVALSELLLGPENEKGGVATLYNWVTAGSFTLNLSILVDPLSVFMLLIVTGVGFVIHVYSIGYMEEDPELSRFFAYMNLFIFAMSVLVLAADFFFLIVGWALVGLASYLLIGFWKEKTSAVLAARKAFVMNVIGDVGMVIAAFIIFEHLGTLNFLDVFAAAESTFRPNDDTILLITLFLLVGAFAKSAQIPLHTWLPDAMEGPTPVSALIHAATMVTAGVYLVARCHVLFELAPFTMYLIAAIGVITALFAGSMGLVQYDIKRVIAYSTMSQLGYMFLAAGVGMYSIA
ncbi:MAG: NADH-quinone oxidoreductase subunit L, partial [Rhodospirillales bacterium]|nr:NADH-quinone oxidoreductase subunit L [Rhodospirillales bacterium]